MTTRLIINCRKFLWTPVKDIQLTMFNVVSLTARLSLQWQISAPCLFLNAPTKTAVGYPTTTQTLQQSRKLTRKRSGIKETK